MWRAAVTRWALTNCPSSRTSQGDSCFAVKTAGDTSPVPSAVRARFTGVAPNLALFDVHTMEDREDLALASRRASLTLAMFFGCLALFLSAVGIYGVLAYLVTQRQREIGIRTALGCTSGGVVKLVLSEAIWLLGGGLLLGGAGAAALQSVVAAQLYGVKPLDPAVTSTVILSWLLWDWRHPWCPLGGRREWIR